MIGDWSLHNHQPLKGGVYDREIYEKEETRRLMNYCHDLIVSGKVPSYIVCNADNPCHRCGTDMTAETGHAHMTLTVDMGDGWLGWPVPDEWVHPGKPFLFCECCQNYFLLHFLGMEGMICT